MYLYSYPSIHAISGQAAGGAWEQFEVCLKMTIGWIQRYTPMPWSSDFGDALGGGNRASLEIHLEAVIKQDWRYALRGHDRAHMQAVLERVWRYTWRPWSSEFGDALGSRDRPGLEMHLQAVIERVWWYTWRSWSSEIWQVLGGGWWTARRDSIHQLVYSQPWECDKVTLPLKFLWRTGWWRSIGREVHRNLNLHSGVNSKSAWERETVDLGLMLYLVYAVLGVNSWLWHGEIERDNLAWWSCDDGRVVDKKERDGGWRWERYGGYEWVWEIRSMTCLIGLEDLVLVLLPAGSGLVPAVWGMVNRLPHKIL